MISSDNAKTFVILGAVVVGGYLAYRFYTAGKSIGDTVGETVGKVKDVLTQAGHAVDLKTSEVGARVRALENGGMPPGTDENQSAAETARLNRQEGELAAAAPTVDVPDYDAMGNFQGYRQQEITLNTRPAFDFQPAPVDSPDAMGLAYSESGA